jgi:hypothetical protein
MGEQRLEHLEADVGEPLDVEACLRGLVLAETG